MKTIFAGSRTLSESLVLDILGKMVLDFRVTECVHGGCRGVDQTAGKFFKGYCPIKVFKADWLQYGKAAGPIRNRRMAEYADALVAIWDGKSTGTKNMIEEMQSLGKIVVVLKVCPVCKGTGQADSGGVHPWGEPINVPCECREEK